MTEAMKLRRFSPRTQQSYLAAVTARSVPLSCAGIADKTLYVIRFCFLPEARIMKQTLLMIPALGCLAVCPLRAYACFCTAPEVSESFKRSRAAFLGEALDIVEPKTSDEKAPLVDRTFTIKFKILQSWKGIPFGAVEFNILWLPDCYECLDLPHVNERYLVFADPASGTESWSIVTSCNRTKVIDGESKPRLMNPDGIDPYHDMKQLDIITKRAFSFEPARFRRRLKWS